VPIRAELKPFYPANWRTLSDEIRFQRASGRCEQCQRPHGQRILCLPDGRWFDPSLQTWRDARGRLANYPTLLEAVSRRTTKVVLATAHLDNNPRSNSYRNLRCLCQRCHLLKDRTHHLRQRWLTYRERLAIADLFLGLYAELRLPSRQRPLEQVVPFVPLPNRKPIPRPSRPPSVQAGFV
jgi:hypothetical protein